MINLAIVGCRSFENYDLAEKEILKIIKENNIPIGRIISGGSKGADKMAEIFAENFDYQIAIFKPDWNIGRKAGPLRNTKIVEVSDVVIAFWDGLSRGTNDTITKAKLANKKVFIVKI